MKYIKYFENQESEYYYWIIPTGERMVPALQEINADPGFIDMMAGNIDNTGMYEFIFVGSTGGLKNGYNNIYDNWEWNPVEDSARDDAFFEKHCKFGGYVKLTEDEITRIELLDDVKKYNL